MSETANMPEINGQMPPNGAISLYGQDNTEDFPVLKAFQQYIDAEQSKARKRMVYLSIFFAVLMAIVIAVFLVILNGFSQRNQALNDRMLEYVMQERNREPAAAQHNPQQEAALKAMTEALTSMQKQMIEQQTKAVSDIAAANARAAQAVADANAAKAAAEQAAAAPKPIETKKAAEAKDEKLERERALLAREKEKLEAEKEALHKREVEYHRRRYYPEYYEKKPAPQKVPKAKRYYEEPEEADETPSQPKKNPDGSLRYFDEDDDAFKMPVDIKGAESAWDIPLE